MHRVFFTLLAGFIKNCTAAILISLVVLPQMLFSQQGYWQQSVDYTIDVSLNDSEHALDGFLKLRYQNNSPDSLPFIWFHCWPNAYKNDRTAFSEQLLQNGRTDFYFAGKEKRGYINRLDFRVDNTPLRIEDHPLYIDVIKVYLPVPLAPGQATDITTPFHVKLPGNFSRGGHVGKAYQVTQWYPKPAVYDDKGWHPMPYLDQGEFYSEFGSYDVQITLPEDYVVAATGVLENEDRMQQWLEKKPSVKTVIKKSKFGSPAKKTIAKKTSVPNQPVTRNPEPATQTLHYHQDRIHDFAWFADKKFIVKHDTVQLASGRVVDAYSYYRSYEDEGWQKSISYIKDAVHFRSALIAEYPYDVVTVVEAALGFSGGMEYPTITNISSVDDPRSLDMVIGHEIGHNWFYGILASNERKYPWMDEGINSYYDKRYTEYKYPPEHGNPGILEDPSQLAIDALVKRREDQPVNTPSEAFNKINYNLVGYYKTAAWLKQVESFLGRQAFDAAMQYYYSRWQFRHPYPDDFKAALEKSSGKPLDDFFAQLDSTGAVPEFPKNKKLRVAFPYSLKDYRSVNRINITLLPGYNMYDGFMAGLAFHNIQPAPGKFQFALLPMYGFKSGMLNGIGDMRYSWYPSGKLHKIDVALNGAAFSLQEGTDSTGKKIFGRFYKVSPSVRFSFKRSGPRSTLEKWLEWRTYIIGEQGFNYIQDQDDMNYYPAKADVEYRYLNQLTYNITDYRALYPYDVQLQLQQGDGFYRVNATGYYFFNYARGGGLQVRAFAAKFGYLGSVNTAKEFETAVYQPKLTAVRGYEDYTYSNYFFGRTEFEGFASQQIMLRDGGLKLRTDLFQGLQGRSDDWIASLNFNTTLPQKMFPVKLPLRLFLDVGTYAEAWKKEAETSRFLYVGGLQVSLLKDIINIYAPVVYSKEFRDNLKSVPEENTFWKRISFSIAVHRVNWRKMLNF